MNRFVSRKLLPTTIEIKHTIRLLKSARPTQNKEIKNTNKKVTFNIKNVTRPNPNVPKSMTTLAFKPDGIKPLNIVPNENSEVDNVGEEMCGPLNKSKINFHLPKLSVKILSFF
jgi:hypothetical protein